MPNKNQLVRMGLNQYVPAAAICLLRFDVESLTSLPTNLATRKIQFTHAHAHLSTHKPIHIAPGVDPRFFQGGVASETKVVRLFVNNHNTKLTYLSATNYFFFDHSHRTFLKKKVSNMLINNFKKINGCIPHTTVNLSLKPQVDMSKMTCKNLG